MKKIMSMLILLLLSLSLFAGTWSEAVNRSFTIQGGYGEVVKVVFTKIPTQSSSFAIGMPFDIEGELVQYSITEDGREISYWSLVSNTNFKLKITAGKLTSEGTYTDSTGKYNDKGSTDKAKLDYIMKFTYSLGYVQGGAQQTATGYFTINTATGTATYAKPGSGEQTVPAEDDVYTVDIMPDTVGLSTIGSVDGSVYFMFTSGSTSRIKNDPETVPSGNYTATVTISVNTES